MQRKQQSVMTIDLLSIFNFHSLDWQLDERKMNSTNPRFKEMEEKAEEKATMMMTMMEKGGKQANKLHTTFLLTAQLAMLTT